MKNEKTLNEDRLVVVNSRSGERYVGLVSDDIADDPEWYMSAEESIELHDVRLLLSHIRMSESGNSVSSFCLIVPIDVAAGPIPRMWIRPSSWYFPKDRPEVLEKIKDLLELCIRNESISRAKNAGIVVQ